MVQTDGRHPVVLGDFLLRLFFKLFLEAEAHRQSAKNQFENLPKLIDGQMNETEAEIKNLLDPNRFNKVPI